MGQVPYGVLTFGSYEIYKQALQKRLPTSTSTIWTYVIAAVLGDLTGSGWLCPSEVVKQQLQAGFYTNTRQAMIDIYKKKGLLGFYQGYWGGVARDVPFRVAQLTTYEVTKSMYQNMKLEQQEQRRRRQGRLSQQDACRLSPASIDLTPMEAAVCGAIAGSISAALTCPLDRIKTLLMTDSARYGGSVVACAAKIVQEEGLTGLVTGMIPRVAYIAPSVAVFFIAYEQVQQRLQHWQHATE